MVIEYDVADILNHLQRFIYEDAVKHKLFDCDAGITDERERRLTQVAHIFGEVREMHNAAEYREQYAYEAADVVIMTMSQMAKEGINLGDYIADKIKKNEQRPIGHEDDRWRRPYNRRNDL